jgi:eukaryotic-like serine/threonine-protein kinase
MGSAEPDCETGPFDNRTGAAVSDLDFELACSPPQIANDKYQLCEMLALGGMGVIYRAHDKVLHRDVAIKLLRNDRRSNLLAVDEFTKEALIMGYLSHPGVPPVYEVGKCEDGSPYHVMKLIDGTTLAQLIRDGEASTAKLLQIFTAVCQTMAYAHSRGVIHLDLKPSNIMVGRFGEVKVMDWGIAKRCDIVDSSARSTALGLSSARREQPFAPEDAAAALSAMTQSDTSNSGIHPDAAESAQAPRVRQSCVNGTLSYMAPEQARGLFLDARADIFSLGGILCEILCGHAPYEGNSVREVYNFAIKGKTQTALKNLHTCGMSNSLVRIAMHCLRTNPEHRPANAQVLAQTMTAHQESTLERVQNDMERFFELSLDLFCIADLDGYFVKINSNFSRVLGLNEAELMSRPFLDFVHEEDRDKTVEQMKLLDQGMPVVRFRNRYQTSTGRFATLEWTAKHIKPERLIFAVARDVSG